VSLLDMSERAFKAEARVAELEVALRDCVDAWDSDEGLTPACERGRKLLSSSASTDTTLPSTSAGNFETGGSTNMRTAGESPDLGEVRRHCVPGNRPEKQPSETAGAVQPASVGGSNCDSVSALADGAVKKSAPERARSSEACAHCGATDTITVEGQCANVRSCCQRFTEQAVERLFPRTNEPRPGGGARATMPGCPLGALGHNPAKHGQGCAGCDAEHERVFAKHVGALEASAKAMCDTAGVTLGIDPRPQEATQFAQTTVDEIMRENYPVVTNKTLLQPRVRDSASKPRPHLIAGEFQSDKYPTTPRGKVPLSVKDPTAQDLLWEYAQRRRVVDAEFSDDLEEALRNVGYVHRVNEPLPRTFDEVARDFIACMRNGKTSAGTRRIGSTDEWLHYWVGPLDEPRSGEARGQFTCPECGREHSGVTCEMLDAAGTPRPDKALPDPAVVVAAIVDHLRDQAAGFSLWRGAKAEGGKKALYNYADWLERNWEQAVLPRVAAIRPRPETAMQTMQVAATETIGVMQAQINRLQRVADAAKVFASLSVLDSRHREAGKALDDALKAVPTGSEEGATDNSTGTT
jgi:hypothetical protein